MCSISCASAVACVTRKISARTKAATAAPRREGLLAVSVVTMSPAHETIGALEERAAGGPVIACSVTGGWGCQLHAAGKHSRAGEGVGSDRVALPALADQPA